MCLSFISERYYSIRIGFSLTIIITKIIISSVDNINNSILMIKIGIIILLLQLIIIGLLRLKLIIQLIIIRRRRRRRNNNNNNNNNYYYYNYNYRIIIKLRSRIGLIKMVIGL